MEVNYQFFVDYFKRIFTDYRNRKVLDFGCGNGNVVIEMRRSGFEFYGVENYYGSDQEYNQRNKSESEFIKYYNPPQEKIPFPNEYFDFIYSNQVFEHIHDIDFVLSELYRVLKKEGIMVHNFPVKEYLVEGHFRIPIIHWFQKLKDVREKLTLLFVKIGYGNHKNGLNNNEYIKFVWKFIDEKCVYRSESEIYKKFSQFFLIERLDKEKLIYHINKKTNFARNLNLIVHLMPKVLLNNLEKRRGSITILAKKKY